jgi:hypothetical protein
VKRKNFSVAILLVSVFMAVDAIGGTPSKPAQTRGTTASAAPAGNEACSLLKKDDAATALGGTVTGPKATGPLSSGGSTVSACEYTGSGLLTVQLDVTRLPANQVAIFKGTCKENLKQGLAGLGEVACWYDNKHQELHVFKGTMFISIQLRGKSDPTDAIKTLAKKVVDQLK